MYMSKAAGQSPIVIVYGLGDIGMKAIQDTDGCQDIGDGSNIYREEFFPIK